MDPNTDQQKRAAQALRVLTAMDRRRAQGTFDSKCEAALQEAEATLSGMTGRALLSTFRAWRDSGVQSFDSTGGPERVSNERSSRDGGYQHTAMRARNGASSGSS